MLCMLCMFIITAFIRNDDKKNYKVNDVLEVSGIYKK